MKIRAVDVAFGLYTLMCLIFLGFQAIMVVHFADRAAYYYENWQIGLQQDCPKYMKEYPDEWTYICSRLGEPDRVPMFIHRHFGSPTEFEQRGEWKQ